MRVDPTGTLAAVAAADRSIRLIDLSSGACVAGPVRGHSEAVAGLTFVGDLGRLVTVSRDGCIFAWRLSPTVVGSMCLALATSHSAKALPQDLMSGPQAKSSYCSHAAVAAADKCMKGLLKPEPGGSVPATGIAAPRRPTIHDLKQSTSEDLSVVQPTAEPPKGRAALLESLLDDELRRQRVPKTTWQPQTAVAGACLPKNGTDASDRAASDTQPIPTARCTAIVADSQPWAARRDHQTSAGVGSRALEDLLVEEMGEDGDGNGGGIKGPESKGSHFGDIEDDDEDEESGSAVEGREHQNLGSLAANQEEQDFKVC